MRSESEIQQLIQIEGRKNNATLLRNNSGAFKDETGRLVRYGLGNDSIARNENIKSSDLIGFTKIVVTPDMVGKMIAVITAIEVKKEDWKPDKKLDKREQAQKKFLDWISTNCGIAFFANSVQRFPEQLDSAIRNLKR